RPRLEIRSPPLIGLVFPNSLVELNARDVENQISVTGAAKRFSENVWRSVPLVCLKLAAIRGKGCSIWRESLVKKADRLVYESLIVNARSMSCSSANSSNLV